jgi:hypothetical protein
VGSGDYWHANDPSGRRSTGSCRRLVQEEEEEAEEEEEEEAAI